MPPPSSPPKSPGAPHRLSEWESREAEPSPVVGVPVVKAASAASAQTSGSFELRKPRTTPPGSRPVEARRSVVIDTALVEVVAAGAVASAPASALTPTETARGVSSTLPAQTSAPSAGPEKPAEAATEVAPRAASAEPASAALPTEGQPSAAEIPETTPAAVGAGQIREEMRLAPSPPAVLPSQTAVSVELRSQPTDEPKTPAIAVPLAEVKKEPSGARVTGEMRVVSSGRSRMPAKVGAKSSFHIDPSLTVDVPASKPASAREDAPAVQPNQGVHRPSGSFSAIESDFFEREADLYKVDKTESFADLDDQKGKSAGKRPGPPAARPSVSSSTKLRLTLFDDRRKTVSGNRQV